MRKNKLAFLLSVFLVCLFTLGFHAQGATIDADLLSKMEGLEAGDTVRVLIRLKDQAPLALGMDPMLARELLKDTATSSQVNLQQFLAEQMTAGRVEAFNGFWLINMVFAELEVALVEQLREFPEVARIFEDFIITIDEPTLGGQTWDHVATTRAPALWEMGYRGQGIKVAITDTGVDITHPEFFQAMGGEPPYYEGYWAEFDENGNQVPNSMPHDTDYHGTHVSGTVLGRNVGDFDIGVAPEAVLGHCLLLPGGGGTFTQVIAGLEWTIDENFHVVNGSWGADIMDAGLAQVTDNMMAAGVLPVFSIGNSGSGVTGVPGNTPSAIGVGAYDSWGDVAWFSGGGIVEYPGYEYDENTRIKPDISAPGVSIYSAMPGGGYGNANGTSMSSPHVAGAAALLLSVNPDLTVYELKELLYNSVGNHVEEGWDCDPGSPGKDTRYGWGRLNVLQGLEQLPPPGEANMVFGKVTNAVTEDPIWARVEFSGPENRVVYTDDEGEYAVTLTEGFYDIFVQAMGYIGVEDAVTVIDDQGAIEKDFALQPAPEGAVTGTATDYMTGEPLEGVTVTVIGFEEETVTDGNGQYQLVLPEGFYQLLFSKDGFWSYYSYEVIVFPGQTTQQDGQLEFGYRTLTGVVFEEGDELEETDENGNLPIEGALVEVLETGQRFETGEDGLFYFNLYPETYTLQVTRLGYLPEVIEDCQVVYGAVTDVPVEMTPDVGTVFGTVVAYVEEEEPGEESTEPVADVLVTIDGTGQQAYTDEDGAFSFDAVPSGNWVVAFFHEEYWYQQYPVMVEFDGEEELHIVLERIAGEVALSDDFSEDTFDEEDGIWEVEFGYWDGQGEHNWHRTSQRSFVGDYSAWHGNPNTGLYPNSQEVMMYTPIEVPEGDSMFWSFYLWGEVESYWDWFEAVVIDEDGLWNTLLIYDGQDREWLEVNLDLSEFTGQTIELGFYFYSDFSINYEGVYIDNVLVRQSFGQEFATISGRVTDEDTGDPIEGARVNVYQEFDGQMQARSIRTLTQDVTDEDGNYSIAVPAGGYLIKVDAAPDYYIAQDFAYVAPGEEMSKDFALEENLPPEKVTGLEVVQVGDGFVDLTWNANDEPDLFGYYIYRSLDGENYSRYGLVEENSFRAYELQNGYTYYFKVTAVDELGQESEKSDAVEGEPTDQVPIITSFNIAPRTLLGGGDLLVTAHVADPDVEDGLLTIGLTAAFFDESVNVWIFEEQEEGDFEAVVSAVDFEGNPLPPRIYQFNLAAMDADGRVGYSDVVNVAIMGPLPQSLSFLIANNPFDPTTEPQQLEYAVPARGRITVSVFTLDNRRVKTLVDAVKDPGQYLTFWDGKDTSGNLVLNGMYVIKVDFTSESGERSELVRHSVVVK